MFIFWRYGNVNKLGSYGYNYIQSKLTMIYLCIHCALTLRNIIFDFGVCVLRVATGQIYAPLITCLLLFTWVFHLMPLFGEIHFSDSVVRQRESIQTNICSVCCLHDVTHRVSSTARGVDVRCPPLATLVVTAAAATVPLERAVIVVTPVADDWNDERRPAAASTRLAPVAGRRLQRQVARQRRSVARQRRGVVGCGDCWRHTADVVELGARAIVGRYRVHLGRHCTFTLQMSSRIFLLLTKFTNTTSSASHICYITIRSPNKVGLNVCPSVRPSTKSFSYFNKIWYVGIEVDEW